MEDALEGQENIQTFHINMSTGVVFTTLMTKNMDQPAFWMYSIEGLLVMLFNLFMFLRIMIVPDLRQQKELVLMSACMLFDFFFGLTYFSAGVWRIYIFFNFEYIPAYSQWQCYWSPPVQLFIFTTPAAGYILLLTALDRFSCIFFPLKYIKLSVCYSYIIMVLPYVMAIPTYIITFFNAYFASTERNKSMECMLYFGISMDLYIVLRWIRIGCAVSVVCLYIPVAVQMFRIVRRQTEQAGLSVKGQKKLLRLTLTTAMITINTIIFFTIPDVITTFAQVNTFAFYIMNMNKGVVNIIALLATQKPLRRLFYKKSNKIAVSTMADPRSMSVAPSKMVAGKQQQKDRKNIIR